MRLYFGKTVAEWAVSEKVSPSTIRVRLHLYGQPFKKGYRLIDGRSCKDWAQEKGVSLTTMRRWVRERNSVEPLTPQSQSATVR